MTGISSKSRLTTALLACFLGIFGTHRFYIGKTKTAVIMPILGISYLVTVGTWGLISLFLIVIPLLWALIDLTLTIFGIMKDKDGYPIKNWW